MSLKLIPITQDLFEKVQEFISDNPKYGIHIKLPSGYNIQRVQNEIHLESKDRDLQLFVSFLSNEIVGTCYYYLDRKRAASTIAVSIASAYQSRGLGTTCLNNLIEEIKINHPEIEYVETFACCKNTASIKGLLNAGFSVSFVERMGYVRENLVEDAVQFTLKLYESNKQDLYSHSTMSDPEAELQRLDMQSKASYSLEDAFFKSEIIAKSDLETILDLGCGTGSFLRTVAPLMNKRAHLTGVDISNAFIKFAQMNHPDGNYIAGDIEEYLSSTEKKFDLITSRYVLTHLPKSKIESVMKLIKERLTDKGRFYFLTLDGDGYQTYPDTPLKDLIFKHKEMVRWQNDGYWRVSPHLPRIIRNSDLKLTRTETFLIDTDHHVSKQTFAKALSGQLTWAINPAWSGLASSAQHEVLEWAKDSNAYGCVRINAWIGERS